MKFLQTRLMSILLIFIICPFALADQPSYAGLKSYKAQAQHSQDPHNTYNSHAQPNRLAAAVNALQACRQAVAQIGHKEGHCELVRAGRSAITTAAQIRARIPEGKKPLFLWKYEHADATVFLAGSVHILKPGLYPLPRQFQQAFEQSDTMVVEVDLSVFDQAQLQQKTFEYGLLKQDQTLRSVLAPDIYAKLDQTTTEYGLPLGQLTKFKPALVSQQLAISALVSVGYDPSIGVEAHFHRKANGKKIRQLETIDLQLGLLLNQPLNIQQQMIEDSLEQMADFEAMTSALIVAWLSGDDQSFAEIFSAQAGSSPESEEFMRQLIDVRNVGMAEKIVGMLKSKGSYFVLIGAGHYVGEASLIKLLKDKGFSGRRIFSDQNI